MKNLLKNILDAPASSVVGAIKVMVAAIIGAEGLELPPWGVALLVASTGVLGIFTGPNKAKK